MEISGETGLTGLIGTPITHSISPAMFNLAYDTLGIDCVYLSLDTHDADLATVVNGLRAIGIRGFNVTMPYKETILPLLDDLSDASRLSGSVNTVTLRDGRLIGHTTDGIGFLEAARSLGRDPVGEKITLLGAGGAAKSILAAAALEGVSAIDVFRRRREPAFSETEALAARIKKVTDCEIRVCDYADTDAMRRSFAESMILVNATNAGMTPHEEGCPLTDDTLLSPHLLVYDIIYKQRTTQLLAMVRVAVCENANGLTMLLYQGAASFACWTGQKMPVDLIKERILP